MTDWPEVTILDVGHGNCTVVRDAGECLVLDIPEKPSELVDLLRQYSITRINAIVISHGHEDHIAGLPVLMLSPEFEIGEIFLNPDAERKTPAWLAVRKAVARMEEEGWDVTVTVGVTPSTGRHLAMARTSVEVLAPRASTALAGVGGRTLAGRSLGPNSMSVVLHVRRGEAAGVLMAGDLDRVGFDEMLAAGPLPSTDVLVFPHHGGRPGHASPTPFAHEFVTLTKPALVAFSVGRDRQPFPREDVVLAARSAHPKVKVACTQLSKTCSQRVPAGASDRLAELPARARASGACCAGSLQFALTDDGVKGTNLSTHTHWVRQHFREKAMCERKLPA